jgi:DNA (cytosine-5)-methyltransferase 1
MLVLSLFPGIGLLDMAFEEEGFCVVRGPDLLWGGDIRRFNPPAGRFDGVIGGPPCQAFSRLRHIVEANGYKTAPNLIPEFERVVSEAAPAWFLMENVPDAPLPIVKGYGLHPVMLRDVWVGGETDRLRRFSFGSKCGLSLHVETLALHRPDPEHSALAAGGGRPVPVPVAVGGSGKKKISHKSALKNYGYKTGNAFTNHLRLQGLPPDFLAGAPFTVAGKIKMVGNGVPLALGRAVARAVRKAIAAPSEMLEATHA